MEGGKGPHIFIPKKNVLVEVPFLVWWNGNNNAGMNLSSIQLESEQFFAKVALLLNGSYFAKIILPHGN